MNKFKRLIALPLILSIALACNLPSGVPTEPPITETPSVTPTETPSPTATLLPSTACLPTLITNTDSNVRSGPGQVYSVLGQLLQGASANVTGKNAEGTWWYIEFAAGPNGKGWIAGSITTASCIPSTLAIIAAPPTPIPPTATFTPIPSITPTVTNTPLVFIPLTPLIIVFLGDISLDDVIIAGGQIAARVSTSGSMSGNFTYKVYVDGSLQATVNATLPAGSQLFYSGVILPPNIFSQNNTVKVVVDPSNAISELDEGNNARSVNCNNVSQTC